MKFKKQNLFGTIVLATFSLIVIGCGSSKVSGTVSFPDGTPLTQGMVYFEKGDFSVTGAIQKDGSFQMGTNGKGNGVPSGTYNVAIMGTDVVNSPEASKPPQQQAQFNTLNPGYRPPIAYKSLIDKKYNSVATSGLTVEVGGSMTYNITVELPTP